MLSSGHIDIQPSVRTHTQTDKREKERIEETSKKLRVFHIHPDYHLSKSSDQEATEQYENYDIEN